MPMIQRLSLSLALTLNWGIRMASQEEELFEEISKFRSTTGNLQDYVPLLDLNRGLDERIEKGIHRPCIQANAILDKEAKLSKEELTAAEAIREMYIEEQPLCDAQDAQECAYIAALVKECLRYYTVLRLALPRASIKDVSYEGTVIPKGTIFFLNAWACNMGL
ncbi:hypothetical protein VTN00DRAFT_4551 [Thermoascus crustaceus]|uniref:uncharacterized protein n=1 Tax=Thermoascus crustaceus TaxID=5088 RepID=UPI003742C9ED